jgi:hypothetical protein
MLLQEGLTIQFPLETLSEVLLALSSMQHYTDLSLTYHCIPPWSLLLQPRRQVWHPQRHSRCYWMPLRLCDVCGLPELSDDHSNVRDGEASDVAGEG